MKRDSLIIRALRIIADRIENRLFYIKYKKVISSTRDRLRLTAFLPKELIESCDGVSSTESGKDDQFKICYIHQEPYMYNMLHPLLEVFKDDERVKFDVLIGSNAAAEECRDYLEKRQVSYRYDIECVNEKYDALLMACCHVAPTEVQAIIRSNSKYCFLLPTNEYDPEFMVKRKATFMRWLPDAIFCEQMQAVKSKRSYDIPIYATGNLKYDLIYETCNTLSSHGIAGYNNEFFSLFRKVFFYITDHSGREVDPAVSFDLYAKTIFDFFREHEDCCLIFRPYKSYIQENISHGFWSRDDVERFKKYCQMQKNVIWDEEDNDSYALSLADAVISDVGCGITTHALPLLKPIAIPLRWDMDCSKELGDRKQKENCYYLVESEAEMLAFMDMVLKGNNEKKAGMEHRVTEVITHYDGSVAQRTKDIIFRILSEGYSID